MKNKEAIFSIGLLIACYMSGCISEYIPKGVEEVKGMLVVEATITGRTTTVKVSRSIGLLENFWETNAYVPDAVVYVEGSDGSVTTNGVYTGPGVYTIVMGELQADVQYRLKLQVEGQEYESAYLTPIYTPEIDSIYWLKKESGAPVRICVATHDDRLQSHYYRWNFRENWEVRSRIMATHTYEIIDGKEVLVQHDTSTPNNIYACWGKDSSRVILLGSTEKQVEYRLPQKELIEIEPTDDRLSVLYHVAVDQVQIRREAYLYFANLQKNIESGGGLFAPMPTEIKGNIRNINDPDEVVIGYVEVSTITSRERYIEPKEGAYEEPRKFCYIEKNPLEAEAKGYTLYAIGDRESYYSLRRCYDCRQSRRATKNKPSWWPTDWPI